MKSNGKHQIHIVNPDQVEQELKGLEYELVDKDETLDKLDGLKDAMENKMAFLEYKIEHD